MDALAELVVADVLRAQERGIPPVRPEPEGRELQGFVEGYRHANSTLVARGAKV
jgi:hypothetical protein